jgi:hypothetical protein
VSYTRARGRQGPVLKCDLCPEPDWRLGDPADTSRFFRDWNAWTVTELRSLAKRKGWRRDKLNRDICPKHPKLKNG